MDEKCENYKFLNNNEKILKFISLNYELHGFYKDCGKNLRKNVGFSLDEV